MNMGCGLIGMPGAGQVFARHLTPILRRCVRIDYVPCTWISDGVIGGIHGTPSPHGRPLRSAPGGPSPEDQVALADNIRLPGSSGRSQNQEFLCGLSLLCVEPFAVHRTRLQTLRKLV